MINPKVFKLCGEITALAGMVSSLTEHDVFTDFSGHVQSFSVRIYNGEYNDENCTNPEIRERLFFSHDDSIKKLSNIKSHLEMMLKQAYQPEVDTRGEE